MNFCPNCGEKLVASSRFCPGCCMKLEASAAPAPAPSPSHSAPKPVVAPVSAVKPVARAGISPIAEYLKRAATSPVFLIFTILYTLVTLLNIFNGSSMLTSIFDTDLLGNSVSLFSESKVVSSLTGVGIFFSILFNVPQILIIIGLWITFGSAAGNSTLRSPVGIRMIRVIFQIKRILWPVACGLLTLTILSACTSMSDAYGSASSSINATIFVIFLVMWGVCALMISFFSKLIESLGSLADCVTTGRPTAPISIFVVVMWFIGANSCLSSLLLMPESMDYTVVLQAAMLIFAACVFIGLRSNLDRLSRSTYKVTTVHGTSWACTCGRVNAQYVTSCVCGRSKTSNHAEVPLDRPTARWECKNCYASNPPDITLCTRCGMKK